MAGKKYDNLFSEKEKEEMRSTYLNGASIADIQEKYGIKCRNWIQHKLLSGITRSPSESCVLAHKKYPQRYKHSEETKEKIRKARLKFMKEHPEQTAWRRRNEPSYPELCFIKFLQENSYDKKYLIIREESVFPFYIDFAFYPVKVAVEIDGSQHLLDEDRKRRDEEKNKVLNAEGWKVLRVTENIVKKDWVTLKEALDDLLQNEMSEDVVKVGIFSLRGVSQKRAPVARGSDGLSEKQRQSHYNQRKVKERPSLQELNELKKQYPLTRIGKMFGVTDNAIRKWIKQYNKTAIK